MMNSNTLSMNEIKNSIFVIFIIDVKLFRVCDLGVKLVECLLKLNILRFKIVY